MNSQHPYKNKINSNIRSESLKDTYERVMPYYEKKIRPLLNLASNKNYLIVTDNLARYYAIDINNGNLFTPPPLLYLL